MFGSNEINLCSICGNNMQLVLLHCQINAKYMETGKQSEKAIVLALSLPPTVHLVTKVTECIRIIYIH